MRGYFQIRFSLYRRRPHHGSILQIRENNTLETSAAEIAVTTKSRVHIFYLLSQQDIDFRCYFTKRDILMAFILAGYIGAIHARFGTNAYHYSMIAKHFSRPPL